MSITDPDLYGFWMLELEKLSWMSIETGAADGKSNFGSTMLLNPTDGHLYFFGGDGECTTTL